MPEVPTGLVVMTGQARAQVARKAGPLEAIVDLVKREVPRTLRPAREAGG